MRFAQMNKTMSRAPRRSIAGIAFAACGLLALAGCGSISLVATTNIPTPLVAKVPVTVALYVPKDFASYVHKEERWSTDWNINLGQAQSEGITRLLNAMFAHVVLVDSVNAAAQLGGDVRAILEPSVEEYAFVTPRDAGSPFFAVSIKYRVNVYSPDGRLADSWGFTGYGTSPSQGLSSSGPLAQATSLALRDAGAKLAVEFRDQAIVRGLLPDAAQPETQPPTPQPETQPPAAQPEAPPPPAETPAATPSAAPESTPTAPAEAAPEAAPSETPPPSEGEPAKPQTSPPQSLAKL